MLRVITLAALLLPCLAFAQDIPTGNSQEVERVVIEYKEGVFSLLSSSTLRKVIPPTKEMNPVKGPRTGFWYELVSADGSVRYRRIIENPVLLTFEGPEPGGDNTASRKESLPAERVFSLLIPKARPGDQLILIGSPVSPNAQGEPAEELARFNLFPVIG